MSCARFDETAALSNAAVFAPRSHRITRCRTISARLPKSLPHVATRAPSSPRQPARMRAASTQADSNGVGGGEVDARRCRGQLERVARPHAGAHPGGERHQGDCAQRVAVDRQQAIDAAETQRRSYRSSATTRSALSRGGSLRNARPRRPWPTTRRPGSAVSRYGPILLRERHGASSQLSAAARLATFAAVTLRAGDHRSSSAA